MRFLFLRTHATSYSFSSALLLYTKKEKGGKADRKPSPLHCGLRRSCRNHKFENSQDYSQKPQRNCTFMAKGLAYGFHFVFLMFNNKIIYSITKIDSKHTKTLR
jgi:hypothetical protein